MFDDTKKVLELVDKGDNLVKLLIVPSDKCQFMSSDIEVFKIVGKGEFGSVFDIKIKGMGEKQYVMKVVFSEKIGESDLYLRQEEVENLNKMGFPVDLLLAPQRQQNLGATPPRKLYLNIPFLHTIIFKDIKYRAHPRTKNLKEIIVPAGSYVCDNLSVSEYLIQSLVSKYYRELDKNFCIHFFNVYTMFSCWDKDQLFPKPIVEYGESFFYYNQYIIMDKLYGDMAKYVGCFSLEKYEKTFDKEKTELQIEIIKSIYVQVIFAILTLQFEYQIMHNDLHLGNIFLELITDKTKFRDQKIKDSDWFHYSYNSKDIYIPAIPVLVKIGDFGLASKFSKPIIGNTRVAFRQNNKTSLMSNYFISGCDPLYFTQVIIEDLKVKDLFLEKCRNFLISGGKVSDFVLLEYKRPKMDQLYKVKTCQELFLSPILEKFGTKPSSGKIVTLGQLT